LRQSNLQLCEEIASGCRPRNDGILIYILSQSLGFDNFILLRVAMNFIENIRVGGERTETGFGAKQNRPSVIFGSWKIRRVGIAENSSAEGDESL